MRIGKLVLTGIISLFFTTNIIFAETLNIDGLVDIMLKNNHSILKAETEVKKADALMMQARSAFIPDVTVKKTFTQFNNNNTGKDDGDSWTIEAVQPLYTGGALPAAARIANKNRNISRISFRKIKEDKVFELLTAYYSILKLEDTVKTLKESLNAMKEHKKVTKANMNAGFLTKNDFLRIEAEEAKVELMLLSAEGNLKKARMGLRFICGGKLEKDFRLSRDKLDFSKVKLNSDYLGIAIDNRSDVEIVKNSMFIGRDYAKIAKSERIPQIAAIGSRTEGEKIVSFPESWQASAQISLNVFDGGYINGVIKEKDSEYNKLKLSYEELLKVVELECINAKIDVETSWQNIEVSKKMVKSAKETLRLTESQYKTGVVSSVILLDDEVKLIDAKSGYFSAIYDYKISIANYFNKLGKITEIINK